MEEIFPFLTSVAILIVAAQGYRGLQLEKMYRDLLTVRRMEKFKPSPLHIRFTSKLRVGNRQQ